jgi:hypothetical protein
MSLNIFIWIELNFHKINSFQLISWLSFVIHNMKAKHLDINVTGCNNLHILSNKWPSLYFTLPMIIYWHKVKIFRVWNHFHFHYFRTIKSNLHLIKKLTFLAPSMSLGILPNTLVIASKTNKLGISSVPQCPS